MKMRFLCLLSSSALIFGCKPTPVATTASPTPETSAPPAVAKAEGSSDQPSAARGRPEGAPPNGGGNRGQRMEQMLASLNLTADQSEKVKAVMEAQRPAMEALRNDSSLSREQRREKMQELRQSMDAQLSTVLTPEQKAKWDQERTQRRERMGRGGNNPPPASPNSTP